MSRRSSSASPHRRNGGNLPASVQQDIAAIVQAAQATFLFDTNVIPITAVNQVVDWSRAMASQALSKANSDRFDALPGIAEMLPSDSDGNSATANVATLKSQVFNHDMVRHSASASAKVLSAFSIAIGMPNVASVIFKKTCSTAAKLLGERTFDLRVFVSNLQDERGAEVIEGVFSSHHENVLLQAVILLALLIMVSSPGASPPLPVGPPEDANRRAEVLDRLQQMTNELLTPTPKASRRKKDKTPREPDARDQALQQRVLELEAQLKAQANRASARPPASRRAGARPRRTSETSSDSSSAHLQDDDDIDEDIEDNPPTVPEYPSRTYHSTPPGTHFAFNPIDLTGPRGTYDELRHLADQLPLTEHQIPNFSVTKEMTTCLLGTFNTFCQTRLRGAVPSLEEALLLMYHRTTAYTVGICLIDITGIPHQFYRSRKPDTTNPPSIARVLNPSSLPELDCLGESIISRHIFPVSPDHWRLHMRATLIKAVAHPVHFQVYADAPTGQARVRAIEAYAQRFRQLIVSTLGTNWKENRHHVSIWAMLLIFHVGRWTHATVFGQLSLLLDNFEREWETHYTQKIKDPVFLSNIFPHSLELLDYRCPKGHRGQTDIACDVCDRGSSSTLDDSDSTDAKRQIDTWHRAYSAWVTEAKRKGISDTSHKAFEREQPYPKAATSKKTRLDRKSFASQQHKITPPLVYEILE